MTESTHFRTQLFTGLAVALLLLTSGTSGAMSVVLAAALFAVGLVLFPELRRAGVIAAVVAAGLALAAAFVLGRP